MALRFIRRVQRQPRVVRQQVAVGVAGCFTIGIFFVWLTTFMATTGTPSLTDSEGNEATSAPFSTFFSSVQETFSEVRQRHDYLSISSTTDQVSTTVRQSSGDAMSIPATTSVSDDGLYEGSVLLSDSSSSSAGSSSPAQPVVPRVVQIVATTTASSASRQAPLE